MLIQTLQIIASTNFIHCFASFIVFRLSILPHFIPLLSRESENFIFSCSTLFISTSHITHFIKYANSFNFNSLVFTMKIQILFLLIVNVMLIKCEDMILGDVSGNREVVHHTSAQYPGINNLRRLRYVVWTSLDFKPITVSILFINQSIFFEQVNVSGFLRISWWRLKIFFLITWIIR